MIIWATLDQANPFIAPSSAPFVIGLAYTTMVVAFADVTISTNLARDLGTRMVAAAFISTEAFTYKSYCWISILVNVPATLLTVTYYEFFFKDTMNLIDGGHLSHPYHENYTEGDLKIAETNGSGKLSRFLSNRGPTSDTKVRPDFSDSA